jgi:hypothetical protein
MTINYIGNCKHIDWNAVIEDCANTPPAYIGPSHKRGDNLPDLDVILDMWDAAEYKTVDAGGTVGWDMFLPGQQFDQSVIDKFVEFFEIPNYKTAWISRINIGRFAPIHWDVHDDEATLGDTYRYHCHIGKPEWGHVFIADDRCFYNENQGSAYRWDSRRYWNAGTNCGITPKYLLNLW